jgi:mono/diheme cytochrome c family protein
MNSPAPPDGDAPIEKKREQHAGSTRIKTLAMIGLIAGFVLWAHLGSGVQAFRSGVSSEAGWERFRADYGVNYFGEDGQFVRAVQNGYNLVFYTYKYAPRFTRKTAGDRANSCSACHTAEDLAYGFVNSDRFDPKLGKRVSFEDRVRQCYAGPMDGFAPTIYDPAVRDIRLFARAVAHHLQLSEGALRKGG